MDFSVTICTYNGAERISEVLDALQIQTLNSPLHWEVVVVDNNSSDHTATVVQNYVNQWRSDCTLRYIFEPKQGLTYARERAIQEAKSNLIGFLDDDTIPEKDWLLEAYNFGSKYPEVGAFGGNIFPKTDVSPSPKFDEFTWSFLAVYNHGSEAFCYNRTSNLRIVPAAPGCVVRKQAWVDCVPRERNLAGPNEVNNLLRGHCDDLEAMYYIQNSDWEIWHNPKLKIWHHIPTKRLERQYLLRVARTSGLSQKALRIARFNNRRSLLPMLNLLFVLYDGTKLALCYLKNKHKFAVDISKACEFESRMGRFLSNFST